MNSSTTTNNQLNTPISEGIPKTTTILIDTELLHFISFSSFFYPDKNNLLLYFIIIFFHYIDILYDYHINMYIKNYIKKYKSEIYYDFSKTH